MNACPASVSSWVRRILPLWSPGIAEPKLQLPACRGALPVAQVSHRQGLESPAAPIPQLGIALAREGRVGGEGGGAASAMPRGRAQAAAQQHQARGLGAREGSRRTWRTRTATKPGATMRHVMAEAVVGDDDYGTDPTIRRHRGTQAAGGRRGAPRALSVVLAGRVVRGAGLSCSLGIVLCVLAAQGMTGGPGRCSGCTRNPMNQNPHGHRIARQSVRTKIALPDRPMRWVLPGWQKGALRC